MNINNYENEISQGGGSNKVGNVLVTFGYILMFFFSLTFITYLRVFSLYIAIPKTFLKEEIENKRIIIILIQMDKGKGGGGSPNVDTKFLL